MGGEFVRTHEIGHNLGLLHGGGRRSAAATGTMVEYGDPTSPMGASFRMSGFLAPDRYQIGMLPESSVISFSASVNMPVKLRSISVYSLTTPPADAVAIKIACGACVPQVSRHARRTGGNLWVQFRGNEGFSSRVISSNYQNKVYVHLARRYVPPPGRSPDLGKRACC